MTINHTVGTRYISSAPPARLISITLAVISFVFGLYPAHAQDDSAILYPGTYQAEEMHVTLPDDAIVVDRDGAEFGKVLEDMVHSFTVYGTNFWLRVPVEAEPIVAEFDGKLGQGMKIADGKNWVYIVLPSSIAPEFHQIRVGGGFYSAQLDSITVLDRTVENLFPYIAAVGITLGMTLFVVASALRERWRR